MIPGAEEQRRLQGKFIAALEGRLEAGRAANGDRSLRRAPDALVAEIEEELLDVAGWSFVLWLQVRGLRGQAG